jgi:hypothetical protein
MTPSDSKASAIGGPRKLLLASVTLLIGLGLVEGANRVRLSVADRAYDSVALRETFQREVDNLDQLGAAGDPTEEEGEGEKGAHRVMHPYTGFDILPALRFTTQHTAYFATQESKETLDILLFGGSVANGFARDASDVLVELLKRDERFRDRPLRVLRYARASFKQPQQINSLVYLLACGFQPDAVINLDGFNEVAVANSNDHFEVNPLQPSVSQWGPYVGNVLDNEELMAGMMDLRILRLGNDALAQRALDSRLLWSSLVGNLFLGRLRSGRAKQSQMQADLVGQVAGTKTTKNSKLHQNPVVRGPLWQRGLESVMDMCVNCWKQSSISMDAICKRRSIFYLHVLQPTLHSEGAKVATEEELSTGKATEQWMQAAQVGYPKLKLAGKELLSEGVEFLDASLVFADVSETLYYDPCHFSKRGQAILAESIAAAFLKAYREE